MEQYNYARFYEDRSKCIILAVYVEDLIIAATINKAIKAFKQQITAKYAYKGLGELDRILDMEVDSTVEEVYFYLCLSMSRMCLRSLFSNYR